MTLLWQDLTLKLKKTTWLEVLFILYGEARAILVEQSPRDWRQQQKKVTCHGYDFPEKIKYIGPIKEFSSTKLKAFSEWGKHHITIPISHMRKQEIGNEMRGWNFPKSGCAVLAALVPHENTTAPHPAALSSVCYRDAPASGCPTLPGSLFRHDTAAATPPRSREPGGSLTAWGDKGDTQRSCPIGQSRAAKWGENKSLLEVILPKTASSSALTAWPQICQHLVAALVPEITTAFCGAIAPGTRLQLRTAWDVHARIAQHNRNVCVFLCVFGFLDTNQKSSYSLTFAKHFTVKYAFIYNTLYIRKDWIYIPALEFKILCKKKKIT